MDLATLDSLDRETLIRLILSQAEIIERLTRRVAELEAKLDLPKKTPDNSSTPPSKGQKPSASAAAGSEEDAGAKKRGKPHAGAHRPLHPNPTKYRDIAACACQHCGVDVSQAAQFSCEAYDHIEIPPIKPEVTRITLQGGTCPNCSKKFKAAPPPEMPKGSPFGENLRALILYLRFTQNIALERLSTLLSTMLGLEISEGAIVNILSSARDAFAKQREAIRARLLSGTILQSDETGLRVCKDNWYLWVFHHEDSAVFVAKPTRAQSVIGDFLGDFTPQYWVSDRYAGQLGWAEKENQVCLAHLIRDVQYVIDAGDDVFAPKLRHLLGRACGIGRRRPDLADATLKTYQARLNASLDAIMTLQSTHDAGIKLQRVIKKIRRHMFVFVTNRDIPATNNGSERALRPCAVFRKITNGFRTDWGAKLYADIRSVIETARRRAIGALQAIRITLAGKPLLAGA